MRCPTINTHKDSYLIYTAVRETLYTTEDAQMHQAPNTLLFVHLNITWYIKSLSQHSASLQNYVLQ